MGADTPRPCASRALLSNVPWPFASIVHNLPIIVAGKRLYTYRFMAGVPLRDGKDAISGNWLEIVIAKPNGRVTFTSSFVTGLTVNRDTVAEIAACG